MLKKEIINFSTKTRLGLAIIKATFETQLKAEKDAHTETKAKFKAVKVLSTKEELRESFKELIEEMRSKDKN